jgi:RNase P subunit RPR2
MDISEIARRVIESGEASDRNNDFDPEYHRTFCDVCALARAVLSQAEELARLREVERKAIERYNALYEAARQYLNTGFTSARHKLREIVAVSR